MAEAMTYKDEYGEIAAAPEVVLFFHTAMKNV